VEKTAPSANVNNYSKMRKYFFIFLVAIISNCHQASAVRYYVSNSKGSDSPSRNGKSEASSWKTFSAISKRTFMPGDSILLKKGDTWRETLIIPSAGVQGAFLYIGSYGKGPNPKILGSEQAVKWTRLEGNLWSSEGSFSDPYSAGKYGSEIFFENNDSTVSWGVHKTSTADCTAEYDWAFASGKLVIYCTADPSTKYKAVEAPQRRNAINLNDKNYLHINGIDLFYVGEAAISYKSKPQRQQKGLVIENSEIGYISVKDSELGYGIDAAYSDMIVRGCEIHNCGRRGISFHIYGSINLSNVLIENNYFHDGYHTTGPDFSVGSKSYYLSHINGVIIRRNLFYDPPASKANTNHIFIQNYHYAELDATISNIFIYSNIFISPSEASVQMEGSQSVFIYNNTFYNHNSSRSETISHVWIDKNNTQVEVKNNIFYSSLKSDDNGSGVELFLRQGQDPSKVVADYNLYYRINNNLRIIEKEYAGTWYMNGIASIRSETGWEKHSPPPGDPLFTDPSRNDFTLKEGSPAIGKGVNLNIPFDFYGKSFNAVNPSIGACEFGQKKPVPPSKKR
jgi:hypothetical protein